MKKIGQTGFFGSIVFFYIFTILMLEECYPTLKNSGSFESIEGYYKILETSLYQGGIMAHW